MSISKVTGWLRCKVLKQHQYETPDFHPNCLYFCTYCNKELLDRTFEDITPLSDDERAMLDWAQQ